MGYDPLKKVDEFTIKAVDESTNVKINQMAREICLT